VSSAKKRSSGRKKVALKRFDPSDKVEDKKKINKKKLSLGTEIYPERQKVPKRTKDGKLRFADHPEFRPTLSPAQIMQEGAFGGTYWRRIKSCVAGQTLSNQWKEFPSSWYEGLKSSTHLTVGWLSYNKQVNKYKVKCGGSLDMWESSGWISPIDPYGWYQWYCRFYLGRRSSDDQRQIKRWLGVCGEKGRFRNQLIGKCARGGTSFDDYSISPVIRQSLLHWGYELTRKDADKYVKLKGLPLLKEPKFVKGGK